MTKEKKETIKKGEVVNRITLDTDIREFLRLPEFRFDKREDPRASRIEKALIEAYGEQGIKTLGDLKIYIDENGWLYSRAIKLARIGHIGIKTIEYFNDVLNKYGLEPLTRFYKDMPPGESRELTGKLTKIDFNTRILDLVDLPELKFATNEKKLKARNIIKGLHYANDKLGIKTLGELKNYVEEKGWLGSRGYPIAMIEKMGINTIEYFNGVLQIHGIKPFGKLYSQ